MNYQASNLESLSETPERLSETKMRSDSAAKKRAAEVLTSCTNLTARSCMTVGLSVIGGLDYWNGLLEWTTGMDFDLCFCFFPPRVNYIH